MNLRSFVLFWTSFVFNVHQHITGQHSIYLQKFCWWHISFCTCFWEIQITKCIMRSTMVSETDIFFLIKLWLDLLQNILLIILILMVTLLTKEDHQNVTISKDLEQELKLLKSYFPLSMSIIVQIRYFSEKSRKISNVLSPYWRVSLNWNRNHYLLIIIQQVLSYY